MKTIQVGGNDACESGYVEITYNKSASVSPLHFHFEREDGFCCDISLHHSSVKELLKLIVNEL